MEDEQRILFEKHKGIARIDQDKKKTYGWYVRVRFSGKIYSKLFSDSKFGGKYSSLLSAISWRNETEKRFGKVRSNKRIVTVANSNTGVVGVRLNEKLNRYDVTWVDEQRKREKITVSISKHGKEKAFSIACLIRRERCKLK